MRANISAASTVAGGGVGPRWAMVAGGAALVGACYGLARFAYGLFAPEIGADLAVSPATSGLIGSGSYVGYCGAIVLSLMLTPRWGARRVGVLAGATASAGLAIVAAAPTSMILATGILLAGSSTGIASPPMAAAVDRWVPTSGRDRAQTMVNAGAGLGVLVSGPVALVLLTHWRWAWALFAVIAMVVTVWVALVVPAEPGQGVVRADVRRAEPARSWVVPGSWTLVGASFIMGAASIAVWTFGRELLTTQAEVSATVSAAVWTALGASGVLGALGGDVVRRGGLTASWSVLMLTMGAATALFAVSPTSTVVVLLAAVLFGSSYIGLTGVALLWSTRLYPDRAPLGVGLSFFMIAAGQAAGAALLGRLIEGSDPVTLFYAWAGLGVVGAALRP